MDHRWGCHTSNLGNLTPCEKVVGAKFVVRSKRRRIGYVRASSSDQNLAWRLEDP